MNWCIDTPEGPAWVNKVHLEIIWPDSHATFESFGSLRDLRARAQAIGAKWAAEEAAGVPDAAIGLMTPLLELDRIVMDDFKPGDVAPVTENVTHTEAA